MPGLDTGEVVMPGKRIGVDCLFEIDGTVRVRRVRVDDQWLPVDQGRQWLDHLGRHVLVMLPDGPAQAIRLRPDTMTWEISPAANRQQRLV
jgi:hypothetical protein